MTAHVHLHHTQLQRWPNNMRTRYNLLDIRRMALSQAQRAADGADPCVHDLVVTPGPGKRWPSTLSRRTLSLSRPELVEGELVEGELVERSKGTGKSGDLPQLFIVAGHLRHAGNAYLGPNAPLLNCVVHEYPDEASMLADMRTENGVRAEISPLGWAMNFDAARKSGKSPRALARESGNTLWFVKAHLALMGLTLKTRELIDSGELPVGAAEHLLKLPPALETKYALSLSKGRATIGRIENVVNVLLKKHQGRSLSLSKGTEDGAGRGATAKQPRGTVSLRPLSLSKRGVSLSKGTPVTEIADAKDITLTVIRQGAAATCAACHIGASLKQPEPAWHLALNAAKQTCASCNIRELKDACASCPLAEMMTRFVMSRPEHPSHPELVEGGERSKGERSKAAH